MKIPFLSWTQERPTGIWGCISTLEPRVWLWAGNRLLQAARNCFIADLKPSQKMDIMVTY
jgi:hypothetical protein